MVADSGLCTPADVAHASFLEGDTLDTFATCMAWFVLIVIPIAGIVLFRVLHVMPVKMAERRHHSTVVRRRRRADSRFASTACNGRDAGSPATR